ncbi:hypothetical protein [Bradyrhizobium sp. USDA 10063]
MRGYIRDAVLQTGNTQTGLDAAGPIAALATVGRPFWKDQTGHQVHRAMQTADAFNITDPGELRTFMDYQARGAHVEGAVDVNPQEYRNAVSTGRSAIKGASLEFRFQEAPGMIAEKGGDRADTAMAAYYSAMLGNGGMGKLTAAARKYQQQIGLRDKNGKLIDEKLFRENQAAWTDKYYRDRLRERGIDPTTEEGRAAMAADAQKAQSNPRAADAMDYYGANYD